MNWSDTKDMTDAIKNIATLIFYLLVILFFTFSVWPRIEGFEIKKVSVAGVELGPKEKAAFKTIEAIPTNISQQGKETGKIPLKVIEAAKLIDVTLSLNNENWVYIGQLINGKLTNCHFKINEIPQQGETIIANDAVYKRKDFPVELKTGDWKLGSIRGVVNNGDSVRIIQIKEIQDKNYWALVK